MGNKKHDNEHGKVSSYVIGFILSLIFTFIPYYLVVNKVFTGTALTLIILAIAVLQMAIQLLFFLHLGRGPKPLYNIIFFFATAGVIVLTIGASLFIMANLYRNMSPEEVTRRLAQEEGISEIGGKSTGACSEQGRSHIVTIVEGNPSPNNILTKRCDTLTFVNQDGSDYEFGFGMPDNPGSYGGLYEIPIRTDRNETITLNEAGSFLYFDLKDPTVDGSFSVQP